MLQFDTVLCFKNIIDHIGFDCQFNCALWLVLFNFFSSLSYLYIIILFFMMSYIGHLYIYVKVTSLKWRYNLQNKYHVSMDNFH